jgi:hypothetical protein
LLQGNPNSAWARRYHDLIAGHISDMGGADMLSEAQAALIRDAAALEIELERMRGRLSEGERVDLDQYGRVAGQRRRILESIGLERRARDVGAPSLAQLIESGTWTGREHENEPDANSGALGGQP